MDVGDFIPGWNTAKLIGIGIGALVIIGLLAFGFFTVKGWRADSLALPAIVKERDQAIAARAALDKQMTGQLKDYATRLGALEKAWAQFAQDHAATDRNIDADILAFERKLPHAPPSRDPALDHRIRDGLRGLLAAPAVPAQPGAGAGVGHAGPDAGLPAAPAGRPAVPGGRRAQAGDGDGRQHGIPLPAAFFLIGSNRLRSARPGEGERGSNRRLAQGSGSAVQGPGGDGFLSRLYRRGQHAGAKALKSLSAVGAVLVETASDDAR